MTKTDNVKERPILMSASMVRAILSGAKTQTRRRVRMEKEMSGRHWDYVVGAEPFTFMRKGSADQLPHFEYFLPRCPYGVAGDHLWVRETFRVEERAIDHGGVIERFKIPVYRADSRLHREYDPLRYKPSTNMPRDFSRIQLEIAAVRIERLDDISEADIFAEGVSRDAPTPQLAYKYLWENINKGFSCHTNPWVWVVSFRRI